MTETELASLRAFVREQLSNAGKSRLFSDEESLFLSSLLGEDALMRLILLLEQLYGVSYVHSGFDATRLDSISKIASHVDQFRKE